MTAGTSASARAMAAVFDRKERQDACPSHAYELPWIGCGYLHCKLCGKRIDNEAYE